MDPRADADETLADRGQMGADTDRAAAESDQAAAESDQAAADSDQAAADSDQAAADSDQAASDRDVASGGDSSVHDSSRRVRDRSADRRENSAQERLGTAAARDEIARQRDMAAAARDDAAAQRDRELAALDVDWSKDPQGCSAARWLLRAAEVRAHEAEQRREAADFRTNAAADREQAACDREQAAQDRLAAATERDEMLSQLALAERDALTGARTRGAGLRDLDLEIVRSRRTTGRLAAAYIDVVGLKLVNDGQGHAAGDALLQRVVREIRAQLRPYDLVIRLGGDEFLCAMSGATSEEARARFSAVRAELAKHPGPCDIKVGFAVLEPDDTPASLIERADSDLPVRPGRS